MARDPELCALVSDEGALTTVRAAAPSQTSLAGAGDRSPRTVDSVRAYVALPRGADPKKYPVDPFLLAGRMTPDAVLAYHTALEFHGKAYSVHKQFVFLTGQAPRPFTFRGHRFRPIPPPKALRDAGQSTIGTFATGAGEGLASMASLYEIMGKRAAVLERLGDAARLRETLALWTRIQADPNGLGDDTPAAAEMARLRKKIGNSTR